MLTSFLTRPLAAGAAGAHRQPNRLVRLFGDLKVRPKLMVLHNVFFLALSASIYFALIPMLERQVEVAEQRHQMMVRAGLEAPTAGSASAAIYAHLVKQARLNLLLVVAGAYVIAVIALELVIMPLYVYGPLHRMLNADRASRDGDRDGEIIDARLIPGDEIGQIMRSRNETVLELRKREQDLEAALAQLKETAAALRHKNELLESQDRLVSLGLLSASVAHELNTPLTVLQGSIEKLSETTRDPHTQERLARMLRVTQRLRKISEGLLGFSRARTDRLEPVSLRPLVDEAWSLVAIDERAAQANFLNAVDPADTVLANCDRILQVFVNLLRNALHAIPPNGHIQVRSRRTVRNGRLHLGVAIEDDGPGIPPEVLPDIFEAFVSTRLDAKGTGLGLTVAEGIVHQHGGSISATNRPGGGASLEVLLPVGQNQQAASKT
jgi:two-component system NtrC family sensor kinase